MKFMILVKADKDSEAGNLPKEEMLSAMNQFNEELAKAGVLLAAEGLQPSSKGVRVQFSGIKRQVVPGPFAEIRQIICGYWIWQLGSMEEAIEWVKKCPNPHGGESEIEIRQIWEAEDFGEALTPELREREMKLRSQL